MEQSIRLERRFAIIDEWLLDLDISDRAVRLYAVLARYADNDTHKAYPSRDTLADRLRCSTKSVDRAAQELLDAGAMTKQHRHNSSIIYTLQVVEGGGHHSPGGSSPVSRGVDTGVELTRTTELEPTKREPLNQAFNQFWSVYPLKKDKPAAKRAFEKALKRASLETIVAGAERYRDDPNRELAFTKYPQGWLTNDAWENPPETPRGRKLTNAENAALLAMKYREQDSVKAIEQPDMDFGDFVKGVE